MAQQFKIGDDVRTPAGNNGVIKSVMDGRAYVSETGVPGMSWYNFAELTMRTVKVNGKEQVFRHK